MGPQWGLSFYMGINREIGKSQKQIGQKSDIDSSLHKSYPPGWGRPQ